MATTSVSNPVTYFKRYRMEMDLVGPLPPVPSLPAGFAWIPWEERLLEVHADVLEACVRQGEGDLDNSAVIKEIRRRTQRRARDATDK